MEWPRMAIALGLLTHMLAFVEGLLVHIVGIEAVSPLIAVGASSFACAICTAAVILLGGRQPEATWTPLIPGAVLLAAYPLQLLFWMSGAA